jgi:hypothetical protein
MSLAAEEGRSGSGKLKATEERRTLEEARMSTGRHASNEQYLYW